MLKNGITWEAPRYPPEPNEKIDTSGNNLDLHIYTDASKTLDGKTSAAFCIPEFDFKCGVILKNSITIFTAELAAIKLALLWILENKDRVISHRSIATRYLQCKQ